MPNVNDFRDRYGPWAVIAGGTTGIGEAYSRELAALGLNLVIIGLERDRLEQLAGELEAQHSVEVRTANLDLACADLLEEVRALTTDIEVGLLVYNAALGNLIERINFLQQFL